MGHVSICCFTDICIFYATALGGESGLLEQFRECMSFNLSPLHKVGALDKLMPKELWVSGTNPASIALVLHSWESHSNQSLPSKSTRERNWSFCRDLRKIKPDSLSIVGHQSRHVAIQQAGYNQGHIASCVDS